MATFGYQLGIINYWMLLADWRNGSLAILLALGVLLALALATRPKAPAPAEDLPIHGSPTISEDAVDDGASAPRPRVEPAITVSEERSRDPSPGL
jgi:hypothetical protein